MLLSLTRFSLAAVAIRLYSGWSYVSVRLGAEVVEYEESGVLISSDNLVTEDPNSLLSGYEKTRLDIAKR